MEGRLSLPANTVLQGDYRITRVIGSGGFGITYEAEDVHLGSLVAVKEYYPVDFGDRDATMSVRPRSDQHRQTFEWGRSRFLQEARMLARFKHPSIVRVARVFEANLTAYMVMDFEQGQSFEAWLQSLGQPPTQEELDGIVAPLLDALEMMHQENFLHRDIAPDNIIVRSDGAPVLLDFGAARHAVADRTRTLTGIVKAGYSPQEQYSSDSRLQGPWSDIYALGATLYRAVVGRPPEDAPSRVDADPLMRAEEAAVGSYRPGFLAAIDACLKVRPSERPQSVEQLRQLLLGSKGGSAHGRKVGSRRAIVAAAVLVLLGGAYSGWYVSRHRSPPAADLKGPSNEPAVATPGKAKEEPIEKEHASRQIPEQPRAGGAPAPDMPAVSPDRPATSPNAPATRKPMTVEEERALSPKSAFKDCDMCPEMVVVPAGEFRMGSPVAEPGRLEFEGPVHKVSFPSTFAAARHAVTRDQFKAFVDATGYRFGESCHAQAATGWIDKPGSSFLSPPGFEQDGGHPVVCVSWVDADAYSKWLSGLTQKRYRLLTEAEREYIARAGTATAYWWGSTATLERANFDTKPRPPPSSTAAPAEQQTDPGVATGRTMPVDRGAPNPWGFFNVHGNVAEWVQDCWNPDYTRAPNDGSAFLTGDCAQRVLRGGAWSSWPEDIRAAYREMGVRDDRYYSVGFRVARDLGKQ